MKDYIVISPFSARLRDNRPNPKSYPYWSELISKISNKFGVDIVQVGITGEELFTDNYRFNLSIKELKDLTANSLFWISVDNHFPQLAYTINKVGIVLWGRSDPNIFGYKKNINILKDIKYLKPDQLGMWEYCDYMKDAFVEPDIVIDIISLNFIKEELLV